MKTFWIYVTTENEAEALRIARTVVGERWAACANQLGGIQSVYWWEGKLCEGSEVALVLKTTEARKAGLIKRIKQLHTYDCPCIVCLPITDGHPAFLDWIAQETAPLPPVS